MSTLLLSPSLQPLGTNCILIGHYHKADCFWTRDEFLSICEHMLNGNPPTDFLLIYRDTDNRARFSKSKRARADRRASWSWDTITGRAKAKVGIGFYPSNREGKTRWGAMDFDAHNGEALRARQYALAAFEILYRHPQLYVVLSTSGSDGWHLFLFTKDFYPIADWTALLKQVASLIGAEIKTGICEIFPGDTRAGSLPYGIRAPGTWNAKTDTLGLIAYSSVEALLAQAKKERKESLFLYHATNGEKPAQLHDSGDLAFYCGINGEWKAQFAITQPGTRHNRLKELVYHIFRQVGKVVAQWNAETQYTEAQSKPQATLAEHLTEFDELWVWTEHQWFKELTAVENEKYEALSTHIERATFKIIRSFANKAEADGLPDFPFPVENVAARLGVSYQAVSKIRVRFEKAGIVEKTANHIPNRAAARYRWLLSS
jgi:hypothetical protein